MLHFLSFFPFSQSFQGGGPWPVVHSLPTGEEGGGAGKPGYDVASPAALPLVERGVTGMLLSAVGTRQEPSE